MEYPEIWEIVRKEKIYTDCSDYDNFKISLAAMNKVLDTYGMQLIVNDFTLILTPKQSRQNTLTIMIRLILPMK